MEDAFEAWLERYHPQTYRQTYLKLIRAGMDGEFLMQILSALIQPPWLVSFEILKRLHQTSPDLSQHLQEAKHLLERITTLKDWSRTAIFAGLPPEVQCSILSTLVADEERFIQLMQPYSPALGKIWHQPSLLGLLERHCRLVRRRGQPSKEIPTLFMVLVTDHLRERTGRPHYTLVGRLTRILFPESFIKGGRGGKEPLSARVRERCEDFRRKCQVAALRAEILSSPQE
ncbi:MAG: hypothetical protein HYZ81_27465 [Nitrospinae bacterium]|nr:hypothetical protein [Nitrospinota bacterium]